MKFVRVELRKNDVGTHIMCVACGKFHADFVIVTVLGESEAGLHKKCVPHVHARRTRRAKAETTSSTS